MYKAVANFSDEIEFIQYLINHGVNINEKTTDGESVLHVATGNLDIDVIQSLINQGANIHGKTNKGENISPLLTAIE